MNYISTNCIFMRIFIFLNPVLLRNYFKHQILLKLEFRPKLKLKLEQELNLNLWIKIKIEFGWIFHVVFVAKNSNTCIIKLDY